MVEITLIHINSKHIFMAMTTLTLISIKSCDFSIIQHRLGFKPKSWIVCTGRAVDLIFFFLLIWVV